jgi:hypothetical protein
MINMGKTSKLAPEEVISRAVEYFGPNGVGLDVKQRIAVQNSKPWAGSCNRRVSNANGNGTGSLSWDEFEFQIPTIPW